MLKRNLIYTAITRGKHLVIIIGQKKSISSSY
ncbi:MAG: ATP-binding domain-containing protein [Rickettsia endosymbiont of Ixodes persulcatus]|nr:ATP-binding domain-containing protein [Rickettsia endosymbiont of Ixodes persulcatus]